MVEIFAKYMVVGAVGTAVNLAVYSLLLYFSVEYLLAAGIAFVAAVSNNFYWNFVWTFKGRAPDKSMKRKYINFFVISLLNFGLNLLLLKFFVDIVSFNKMAGQVVAIGMVSILNFVMNNKFTFR